MIGKLTGEQIDDILKRNVLGRIGCHDGKKTYVVPVNYIYDGHFILAHSLEGMKIEMMRKQPQVCFEVDEMQSLTNWRSVIVWGEYQELTEERERYYAMKLFVDKGLHLKISDAVIPSELNKLPMLPPLPGNNRPVIYRIVITERTGKFERD